MTKYLFVILGLSLTFTGCTKKAEVIDNTFTYGMIGNLKTLDPVSMGEESSAEVANGTIYEGLLQYSYLKRPLQVEPLLADGMPTVSKDGLTYTFKIKKGVLFHDSEAFPGGKGRELVAQDFIYNWKRLADPKTLSEGFWIFDGKVKGFSDWRKKIAEGKVTYDTPIEGFEAPDAHTLVIKLERPFYQLNYVLAMTYSMAYPKEAVDKYGPEFMNHPVGTGPFRFESWIHGNKITLVRNPTYHGGTYPTEGAPGDKELGLLADAGKPIPFIDKLVFLEITEDQPRWLNLMKGNLDAGIIPKDSYDSAIVNKQLKPEIVAKGMTLQVHNRPEVVFIGFNMEDPIIGKNVNLRRALALAYDTKTEMDKFYNNRAIEAQSVVGPDMDIWDPNFKNPWKEFNISKAKEFMKKAGYPDGKGLPPIEYNSSSSSTDRQFGEYAAQQWAKIGVKVNLVLNSWPQFMERIRTKKAQTLAMAWGADYPDSENMFGILYSKNEAPGPNSFNFKNKDFDALYEKSVRMPPGPQRDVLYRKMRDMFVDEMPFIPTVHRLGYSLRHGWVSNWKRHETIQGMMYKYVKIDVEKKKELKAKL